MNAPIILVIVFAAGFLLGDFTADRRFAEEQASMMQQVQAAQAAVRAGRVVGERRCFFW